MSLALCSAPIVPLLLSRLEEDPVSVWAELRDDCPVAEVPALGLTLITASDDVERVCRDSKTFSAETPEGPLSRTVGENFMHADGDAHRVVRQLLVPLLRSSEMRKQHEQWLRQRARLLIAALGSEAEVMAELAHPLSAALLCRLTGVEVDDSTYERWFRALAAGAGNFEHDPGKQERAAEVGDEINEAVRSTRPAPGTVLAALHEAGLSPATAASVVKLFVIGGLQEPRDLMGFALWGLLTTQNWHAAVDLADAIEEAARWGSPIGTLTRTVTTSTELSGHTLRVGTRVAAVIAAANHDPKRWPDPAAFRLDRGGRTHLAYGTGPHTCVGAAASRLLVRVAVEELLALRPNLQLIEEPTAVGYEFRGPLAVRVST